MIDLSRAAMDKESKRKTLYRSRVRKSTLEEKSTYARIFNETEINKAIKNLKSGKAAGFDGIFPEFIKHSGPKTRQWLAKFYTDILLTGLLPK